MALMQSTIVKTDTLALYRFENNNSDSSANGYDLSMQGTVPYSTSIVAPWDSNYSAGVFSDTNYFPTPASLNTALSSFSNYTIEFYLYLNSTAGSPVMFDCPSNTGDTLHMVIQVTAANTIRWWGRAILLETASIFSTGAWHHLAFTFDGTTRKIYLNNNEVASAVAASSLATIGSGRIGRWNGANGLFVNGYLDNFRISNVARTSFPTLD